MYVVTTTWHKRKHGKHFFSSLHCPYTAYIEKSCTYWWNVSAVTTSPPPDSRKLQSNIYNVHVAGVLLFTTRNKKNMAFIHCWKTWHSFIVEKHGIHSLLKNMAFIHCWKTWHSFIVEKRGIHSLLKNMAFIHCWKTWHLFIVEKHGIHSLLKNMAFIHWWITWHSFIVENSY